MFERAEAISRAVLYEGYALYPYRPSAGKNRPHTRWQFGVLVPRDYAEAEGSEPWFQQTECLLEAGQGATLSILVRCLQLRRRVVEAWDGGRGVFEPIDRLEVDGQLYLAWDEGERREIRRDEVPLAQLSGDGLSFTVTLPAEAETFPITNRRGRLRGRLRTLRQEVEVRVKVRAEELGPAVRVSVRVENVTPWPDARGADRYRALERSLLSAHTLLAVRNGAFVSLLEPPAWAAELAAGCVNVNTWPVLAGAPGERDLVLSSPIILYDYPAVAPESPADLFDNTEIDELLLWRVATLTDAEKAEAAATDPQVRAVLEAAEARLRDLPFTLHGAVRSASPVVPDRSGRPIRPGCRVRLKPGRRADVMDIFLSDRVGRVEGLHPDVDGTTWVAVTLEDDPAGELHRWYGRFLYFYPDEVEVIDPGETQPGG